VVGSVLVTTLSLGLGLLESCVFWSWLLTAFVFSPESDAFACSAAAFAASEAARSLAC
jgi:hypothetical protein